MKVENIVTWKFKDDHEVKIACATFEGNNPYGIEIVRCFMEQGYPLTTLWDTEYYEDNMKDFKFINIKKILDEPSSLYAKESLKVIEDIRIGIRDGYTIGYGFYETKDNLIRDFKPLREDEIYARMYSAHMEIKDKVEASQ